MGSNRSHRTIKVCDYKIIDDKLTIYANNTKNEFIFTMFDFRGYNFRMVT